MNSIEISIANQKYLIKSEEGEAHLKEVAEMVRRRVEAIRKKNPNLTLQKVAILAAFDFANDVIQMRKKGIDSKAAILNKAQSLLERVERDLETQI
ncbi:MAG: cell division protein ZapA [Deltaproteobacteria bacterium]|nr:cell division protein ZapA [Deltaproteobacteria bacterium]MBM4317272.1 cell division protein ZapA [Deltaproteobacteria bacterium]